MMRKMLLPLLAVAMLCFAVYHVVRAQQTPPKPEPPVQPARSPFAKMVAGAGIVEPQTENISVGTNLPGVVTEVFVKVRQQVEKGQPLFRLDDRALASEKRVREAAVAAASAQLAKLQAMPRKIELPAYEARVAEAEANLADQIDLWQRARRLTAGGAISDEERSRREQAMSMSRQQLARARADLALMKDGAWGPDKAIAEATLLQQKELLRQTDTEIDRLTVRALVSGEVLQVNVRPGEYVMTPSSTALIVLGNVNKLHVRVDIDEHDIPRFNEKAKARATLRGDPSQEFPLEFVRLEPYVIPKKSLTGDNTERVDTRVLQIIYAVGESSRKLWVGQQVDVYVDGMNENAEKSRTTEK